MIRLMSLVLILTQIELQAGACIKSTNCPHRVYIITNTDHNMAPLFEEPITAALGEFQDLFHYNAIIL